MTSCRSTRWAEARRSDRFVVSARGAASAHDAAGATAPKSLCQVLARHSRLRPILASSSNRAACRSIRLSRFARLLAKPATFTPRTIRHWRDAVAGLVLDQAYCSDVLPSGDSNCPARGGDSRTSPAFCRTWQQIASHKSRDRTFVESAVSLTGPDLGRILHSSEQHHPAA